MEGLKHYCQNWGEEVCHPDVAKWKHAHEVTENEPLQVQPAHPIMDIICRKCQKAFFVVDQAVCPKCDSTRVTRSGGAHKIPGRAWHHGHICQECRTYFWIPERIL